MTAHENFDAVLAAARDGHADALRALWTWYAPSVAAYAGRKGSREPEELTSDVFLAVLTGLATFDGDESGFRALVFTIAHRRVVDELRHRYQRGDPVPLPRDGDPAVAAAPSAEDAALDRWGSVRARELLQGLPPEQRDVLVLRILGDLSVEQVAGVVGKSVGAVRSLQARGLARLRRTSPVQPTRGGGPSTMWGMR